MSNFWGTSWGQPFRNHASVEMITNRLDAQSIISSVTKPFLVYGRGNSYGDVCRLKQGRVLCTDWLNKYIAFDWEKGMLRCEAGVTMGDIQRTFMPRGWCLPVTPGTQDVTVGGAIANDVHGKNHHSQGTFGCHVLEFTLIRSDGQMHQCRPNSASELFQASIGGLGLTGVIVDATLQLMPCPGTSMQVERFPFYHLEEFWHLLNDSESSWDYRLAWLDCITANAGRGVFMRARHHQSQQSGHSFKRYRLPYPVNWNLITRPVNWLMASKIFHDTRQPTQALESYDAFFYPLDKLERWSKFYGRKGMYQFQCVLPMASAKAGLDQISQAIHQSKLAGFLASLKYFSDKPSPGLLSFPVHGISLAVDFAASKSSKLLICNLNEQVNEIGGKIYAAKDALLTRDLFHSMYPQWQQFLQYTDNGIRSDFAHRLIYEENT